MLALTGDIEFNKDIRLKAGQLGMHLNEFGLWRWQSNEPEEPEAVAKGSWELMEAETEEAILAELGVEWIEPTKRNFAFVVGKPTKKRATTIKGKSRE